MSNIIFLEQLANSVVGQMATA